MQVPRPHPTQTYRIRISAGRSRNLHFNKLPHIILTQIRSLWYLAFKTLPYLVPASLSSQPSCLPSLPVFSASFLPLGCGLTPQSHT